jgi:hypothetical protein
MVGGSHIGVLAPVLGGFLSETNDNSVAVLLNYGTACVLLAGDVKLRRSTGERFVHEALSGHQHSETTHTEPRCRALLTEGASEVELAMV